MDDTEKIVIEICRRKRDGASGKEIQQWTRMDRDRIIRALEKDRDRIFRLTALPDDPVGYRADLIPGPELARIIGKYEEILTHCKPGD
jgi:hypothetical protein